MFEQALQLLTRLANWYYLPAESEVSFYRRIGARQFGRYVPTGGSRIPLFPSFLVKKANRRESVESFIRLTLGIELGHEILAGAVAILSIYIWLAGFHLAAVASIIINVVFNGYPIILQRYNRFRAIRILGA